MSFIIQLSDKAILSIRSIEFGGINIMDQNSPVGADVVKISYYFMEPFIPPEEKKIRWMIVESNTKTFNGSYGTTSFEELINTVKRFARDLLLESYDKTSLVIEDQKTVQEKEKELLTESGFNPMEY